MNWFFDTYLPGVVFYVVVPIIAGIAYACILQFQYRRRLLRAQAALLEAAIASADEPEEIPSEIPALIPTVIPAAPEVLPEPEPPPTTLPAPPPNPLEAMIGGMLTENGERPETAPGFIAATDAATLEQTLDFFKSQEGDAIDPLQAILAAEAASESPVATASMTVPEIHDPFGEDLAETILGAKFNLNTLDSILPSQSV